jgi:hypothetical protein
MQSKEEGASQTIIKNAFQQLRKERNKTQLETERGTIAQKEEFLEEVKKAMEKRFKKVTTTKPLPKKIWRSRQRKEIEKDINLTIKKEIV